MEFHRFWAAAQQSIKDAKNDPILLRRWKGSDYSFEEALAAATAEVSAVVQRLKALPAFRRDDLWSQPDHHYAYGTHGTPEELIEKLDDENAITRNRYGCLVLNTNQLMFVDIDFPRITLGQRFGRLLGKPLPDYTSIAVAKLKEWLSRNPGRGVRVYRTAGGLRYILTDAPYKVDSNSVRWLEEMSADTLYTRLCVRQNCFRARLTPKPWRLKMAAPASPSFLPRKNEEANTFGTWLTDYKIKSADFAVCSLIEQLGQKSIVTELAPLVSKHDLITGVTSSLPLA